MNHNVKKKKKSTFVSPFNVFETDPNYAGSLGIPTSNTGVNITPDNHHITANIGEPMSAPTGRKSKESFCSAMKIRTLILDTALRKYSLTHWLCYLVFLPAGPSNWVPVRTVVAAPVTQKFEHDSVEPTFKRAVINQPCATNVCTFYYQLENDSEYDHKRYFVKQLTTCIWLLSISHNKSNKKTNATVHCEQEVVFTPCALLAGDDRKNYVEELRLWTRTKDEWNGISCPCVHFKG